MPEKMIEVAKEKASDLDNITFIRADALKASKEFVALCEKFDKEIIPNCPGYFRRVGVIALANFE